MTGPRGAPGKLAMHGIALEMNAYKLYKCTQLLQQMLLDDNVPVTFILLYRVKRVGVITQQVS